MKRIQQILLVWQTWISVVFGTASDTAFLVAFLSNPGTTDPKLIISNNGKSPTTVSVSVALNSTHIAQEEVMDFGVIEVPYSLRMDTDGVNDRAILITSNLGPILVSAKNSEAASTDTFLVIPITKLGKHHTILTYSSDMYKSEFAIVASQNNTLVNITYPDGTGYSLILQQYESYREASDADPTGTLVIASEPIAVFAGGVKNNRGFISGHIAEQLLAVEFWGRTFLASAMSSKTDMLRIVGHTDTTAIRIWRNTTDYYEFYIITPLEFWEINLGPMDEDHLLIEANDTVLIGQFSQSNYVKQRDNVLGFTQVIATEQFSNSYTTVQEDMFNEQSLRIVASDQSAQEILRDGTFFPITLKSYFPNNKASTVVSSTGKHTFDAYPDIGMNLFCLSANDAYSQLVDIRLEMLPQNCLHTTVVMSDAFDNDCDGNVDEEIDDLEDNDQDGVTDEDTRPNVQNTPEESSTTTGTAQTQTQPSQDVTTTAPASTTSSTSPTNAPTSQNTDPPQNNNGAQVTTTEPGQNDPELNPGQSGGETTTSSTTSENGSGGEANQGTSTTTTPTGHGGVTENGQVGVTEPSNNTPAEPKADVTTTTTTKSDQTEPKSGTTAENGQEQPKSGVTTTTTTTESAQTEPKSDTTTEHGQEQPKAGTTTTTTESRNTQGRENRDEATGTSTTTQTSTHSHKGVVLSPQSTSTDDIGILTIVAPSFICGVPLLIVALCCVRSIMAGACRKKITPGEKNRCNNVQPVFRNY